LISLFKEIKFIDPLLKEIIFFLLFLNNLPFNINFIPTIPYFTNNKDFKKDLKFLITNLSPFLTFKNELYIEKLRKVKSLYQIKYKKDKKYCCL
jgi:hypothetical protein